MSDKEAYVESNDPNSPIRCAGCRVIFPNDDAHMAHLREGLGMFADYIAMIEEEESL